MDTVPFHIPVGLHEKHIQAGLQTAFAMVAFPGGADISGLVSLLLGTEELLKFTEFKFAKRQQEWLAGRWAAKSALWAFLGHAGEKAAFLPKFQVISDSDGKPTLLLPDNYPQEAMPAISISHSKGLAVAMAANTPACGIDIQRVTDTLLRVREKFINSREMAILFSGVVEMDSEAGIIKLAQVWSAKEAIRKKHGRQPLPGFMEITLLSEKDIDGYGKVLNFKVSGSKEVQQVFSFSYLDYSCAYCV